MTTDQIRYELAWLARARAALRHRQSAVWLCCVFDRAAHRRWQLLLARGRA